MELSYAFILVVFPGLIAFGVARIFTGTRSRPLNEIVSELVIQSAVSISLYWAISKICFLGLPQPSQVILAAYKIGRSTDVTEIETAIATCSSAFLHSAVVAALVGFLSALCMEFRVLRRLGKRFSIFQSDAEETSWKSTFAVGSYNCWVQVDTKGGQRYAGLSYSVSWQQKDGGIGLSNVKLYDLENNAFIEAADFIYIPSDQINGPILFLSGNTKEESKNVEETGS